MPDTIPVSALPRTKARRERDETSEAEHQAALIQWAAWKRAEYPELRLLMHIPNGGHRDVRVARKLVAQGVRKGVPDLLLPVARHGKHGLWIEMKSERGRLSDEQREWIQWLLKEGYLAVVCVGWMQAVQAIEWYLSDHDPSPPHRVG